MTGVLEKQVAAQLRARGYQARAAAYCVSIRLSFNLILVLFVDCRHHENNLYFCAEVHRGRYRPDKEIETTLTHYGRLDDIVRLIDQTKALLFADYKELMLELNQHAI